MQKPSNYDETKVGGDFTPVELGGHHAVIKEVKEQKSSTGKDMIVVAIDFAANDKQAGYFMDSFENDIRPDKKWPFQAVQYIVVEGEDGKTTRNFKSFITSFEKSNNCEAVWGESFCKQFKHNIHVFKRKDVAFLNGCVIEGFNGFCGATHCKKNSADGFNSRCFKRFTDTFFYCGNFFFCNISA